jgi:small subunit ribosomal protein S17
LATVISVKREMQTENETVPGDGVGAPQGTARRRRRNQQTGVVVKARMQKTVVVAVERLVRHDLYRKTVRLTSTFLAHDEKGARKGDTVRIVETRPLSKLKRWRVDEILSRAGGAEDETPAPQA